MIFVQPPPFADDIICEWACIRFFLWPFCTFLAFLLEIHFWDNFTIVRGVLGETATCPTPSSCGGQVPGVHLPGPPHICVDYFLLVNNQRKDDISQLTTQFWPLLWLEIIQCKWITGCIPISPNLEYVRHTMSYYYVALASDAYLNGAGLEEHDKGLGM